MREFPIYDGNGKEAKPTGQKRILEYGLRSNNFTVKLLSKDSTEVSSTKQVARDPVKSSSPDKKKETTSKKKSKKHTTEKKTQKKKKKKKHRSSDDDDN